MTDKKPTIQDLEKQIEYLETFITELTADDEAGEWCLRARDIQYTRVFPQTYIYKMVDRASYDIWFLGGYSGDWVNDDASDKYKYFVEYYRPLTDEELIENNLRPHSENAHKFKIGDIVISAGGYTGEVVKRKRNLSYEVKAEVDDYGTLIEYYRQDQLELYKADTYA